MSSRQKRKLLLISAILIIIMTSASSAFQQRWNRIQDSHILTGISRVAILLLPDRDSDSYLHLRKVAALVTSKSGFQASFVSSESSQKLKG